MAVDLYTQRQALLKRIEKNRKSRVICYVTGDRRGMETMISHDVMDLFSAHLDALFPTKKITLVLYTTGGVTLAAWNIINLLRMFCDDLEVIVPAKARSAGTLMCLGANRIVMTKQATLGPIDPSLTTPLNPQIPGAAPSARAQVSAEAINGYLEMARKDFGIKEPSDMVKVLVDLAQRVHPLVLGEVYRSRSQIQYLADRLLQYSVTNAEKKKKIIAFLCSDSGSHDYTINRREAASLGLMVEKSSETLYAMLKALTENLNAEMELAVPFTHQGVLAGKANAKYQAVRCVIESSALKGHIFVSEGEIRKTTVNNPPQDAFEDKRTFEGWRQR